jgi:hypothetical protein
MVERLLGSERRHLGLLAQKRRGIMGTVTLSNCVLLMSSEIIHEAVSRPTSSDPTVGISSSYSMALAWHTFVPSSRN